MYFERLQVNIKAFSASALIRAKAQGAAILEQGEEPRPARR
jgi:hypothetical protein